MIQVLQMGDTDSIEILITGDSGKSICVQYSTTGGEASFQTAPGGESIIGDEGVGRVTLALRNLCENEIYLRVEAREQTGSEGPSSCTVLLLGLSSTQDLDQGHPKGFLTDTLQVLDSIITSTAAEAARDVEVFVYELQDDVRRRVERPSIPWAMAIQG